MTTYLRPGSLREAISLLGEHQGAQVLAGGTDLINEMRLRRRNPPAVIDSADLDDVRMLTADRSGVRLGAAVTLRRLLAALSPDGGVSGRLAALADAARLLGGRQIQNVASVGGNICHASPAAETATPLLVHDAEARLEGPRGARTVPIEQFWLAPGETIVQAGELLVELCFDAQPAAWTSAYRRLELRRSVDIAVVSAAASLAVTDRVVTSARLAVGAAGPVPFRVRAAEQALAGVELPATTSAGLMETAGDAGRAFSAAMAAAAFGCEQAARPISDVRASAEYRGAMVRVVAGRAIRAAAGRALPGCTET